MKSFFVVRDAAPYQSRTFQRLPAIIAGPMSEDDATAKANQMNKAEQCGTDGPYQFTFYIVGDQR